MHAPWKSLSTVIDIDFVVRLILCWCLDVYFHFFWHLTLFFPFCFRGFTFNILIQRVTLLYFWLLRLLCFTLMTNQLLITALCLMTYDSSRHGAVSKLTIVGRQLLSIRLIVELYCIVLLVLKNNELASLTSPVTICQL